MLSRRASSCLLTSFAIPHVRFFSKDLRVEKNFREIFKLPPQYDYRTWFPLHMSVQLKKMEAKVRSVDLIIEVHDARIPISCRNEQFLRHLYAVRPHILVMNKMDLIDMKKYRHVIEDYYHERGVKVILFTDCKKRLSTALNDLKHSMLELMEENERFNRTIRTEYQAMVVGIPNVGKSSLINALRTQSLRVQKKAVDEGARPGVTVRVQNRVRIMDRPLVYIIDTPGVLSPSHRNVEEAMKMALCGLILDSHVNIFYLADYLLFWLNRTGDYSYMAALKIDGDPCDDIRTVLPKICEAMNFRLKTGGAQGSSERWDLDKAAQHFVNLYRSGYFKDHCLDKDMFLETR